MKKTASKADSKVVNLFSDAKVEVKKAKADSNKKNIVVKDATVSKAINDLVAGRDLEKQGKALQAKAAGIIKPFANLEWMSEVKQSGKRPESFILGNGKNGVMYIAMDAYKGIDKDRADYLTDTYGKDIVTHEEEFVINKETVEKYSAVISAALAKTNIPVAVLKEMFTKRVNYTVTKGTIENIVDIAKKAKVSTEVLFNDIQPTQQLKVNGEKDK